MDAIVQRMAQNAQSAILAPHCHQLEKSEHSKKGDNYAKQDVGDKSPCY
jgi:hypothetical protein